MRGWPGMGRRRCRSLGILGFRSVVGGRWAVDGRWFDFFGLSVLEGIGEWYYDMDWGG